MVGGGFSLSTWFTPEEGALLCSLFGYECGRHYVAITPWLMGPDCDVEVHLDWKRVIWRDYRVQSRSDAVRFIEAIRAEAGALPGCWYKREEE